MDVEDEEKVCQGGPEAFGQRVCKTGWPLALLFKQIFYGHNIFVCTLWDSY